MIFALRADPYQSDIVFCIEATDAQIAQYMKRVMKVDDTFLAGMMKEVADFTGHKNAEGRTLGFDNGAIMIVLKSKVMGATTMGLLVHEVYHAACYILRRSGVEQSEQTEEAYAYLIQHLCEQAFRKIGNKWWK